MKILTCSSTVPMQQYQKYTVQLKGNLMHAGRAHTVSSSVTRARMCV